MRSQPPRCLPSLNPFGRPTALVMPKSQVISPLRGHQVAFSETVAKICRTFSKSAGLTKW